MTADCLPKWTSWLIKTYFSSKLFLFMPESKLHTQHIPLLLKRRFRRFRRFRFLLIHSFVTPKNMEKSSQNFGDQPLKIQIVQVLFERSDLIPDSFAWKVKHFFLWIAHFTSFSFVYSSVARITRLKKFSKGHSWGSIVSLKMFPHVTSFVQLVGELRRCCIFFIISPSAPLEGNKIHE